MKGRDFNLCQTSSTDNLPSASFLKRFFISSICPDYIRLYLSQQGIKSKVYNEAERLGPGLDISPEYILFSFFRGKFYERIEEYQKYSAEDDYISTCYRKNKESGEFSLHINYEGEE